MKKISVIGGGAAGMAAAVMLAGKGNSVTVLERGTRLGRKLSASGNGQGNVTNVHMGTEFYHSDDIDKLGRILSHFSEKDTVNFLESMGGIFLPDARGRVYPASRQASAVTDLFRREMERLKVGVVFGAHVNSVTYADDFCVKWAGGQMHADAVVLAAGGKAAKNFGTDGSAYALAESFGHTVTPLSPAIVQLRCDPVQVRGLKGIRTDANLTVIRQNKPVFSARGDVLFTESGLSGDAAFKVSSYAEKGDTVILDFLPGVPEEKIRAAFSRGGMLCVVHSALGRMLAAGGGEKLVKNFPLTVTGTLGFDYAQVTRGGIPLCETDDNLMSKHRKGLFFAGEILNADGVCGGYNLQWAFASAHAVSEGI